MPAKTAPNNRRSRRKPSPIKRFLKRAVYTLFIVLGIAFGVVGYRFAKIYQDSESLITEVEKNLALMDKRPSVIYSSDGKVLFRVSSEYRDAIKSISEVPDVVKNATLAAEDKRFYHHSGVDYIALVRMLFTNAKEGRLAQGGSTLTMQLAKRITTKGEKTFDRKMRDIALAYRMENQLTKDQILIFYLNQVFYGNGAYGIRAAANVYFGKRLDQLTVAEAALLARLVRRPTKENPYHNLDAAIRNRNVVLKIMLDEKMIDQKQYEHALREKVALRKRIVGSGAVTFGAPYFVQYVLSTLKKECPEVDLTLGGYEIYTTLDSRIQECAEEEVRNIVKANRRRKVTTSAFVMMDADGKIVAMVGGVSFKRNQYNIVVQGKRQPGSAFKPFVYATALETGALDQNDRLPNQPVKFPNGNGTYYTPENSNHKYSGPVTIKTAIQWSINVPAVNAIEKTGPVRVVDYAHDKFGFTSKLDPYLSLALGASAVSPLEMAQGYSVFMLMGDRATPYGITRVVGPDGMVVKAYKPNIIRGCISASTAQFIDECLRAVVTGGTAASSKHLMPDDCRGKTGTTSDNRDAWFCGYTPNLVAVGWVGNESYNPAKKEWVYSPMSSSTFGGTVTVKMWAKVMKKAHDLIGRHFKRDEGTTAAEPVKTLEAPEEPVPGPEETPTPGVDDLGNGVTEPTTDVTGGTDASPQPVIEPPAVHHEPNLPTITSPEPKRPVQPERKEEYEEVEICAETGLRATIYCPETIVKKFVKGKAPRGRCKLHRPDN